MQLSDAISGGLELDVQVEERELLSVFFRTSALSEVRVIVKNPLERAKIHQRGNPRKNLPARPVAGIRKEDRKPLKSVLLGHIFDPFMSTEQTKAAIENVVLASIQRSFETSTAPNGKPWAPLKPATVLWKAARGYPPDILQATGLMRESYSVSVEGLRGDNETKTKPPPPPMQ